MEEGSEDDVNNLGQLDYLIEKEIRKCETIQREINHQKYLDQMIIISESFTLLVFRLKT